MRHFRKGDVQYFESIQKQTRRYCNSRFLDVMTRLTSNGYHQIQEHQGFSASLQNVYTITKLLAMSEDGRTDVDDKNGHQHSEGNRNKHIKDIIK